MEKDAEKFFANELFPFQQKEQEQRDIAAEFADSNKCTPYKS